ncbi:MAG: class II fructose-bisphosphate aldolase [Eubacterium sp.]|nr:class II fructose-bisphosphate aldolase [Eubacterium sp.]MBQ6363425.1 class II fructose-bisphosphate aldolase [Lachnospiraceae bacterium]
MSLVGLTELVDYSKKNCVGIGMFNIVNLEFATAMYEACIETGLPIMLGVPERFLNYYDIDVVAAICKEYVKRTDIPMALHLDHGKSFDGVMKALRAGFSSVMFDGSALSYEENLETTAQVVRISHAMGVSVEAELGYVGQAGDELSEKTLTNPDTAADFEKQTGIDALAIAIGNQHGQYKGIPKLDFNRLKEIRAKVDCGLVLHGGSGIAPEDFVEAIRCGINKINIYTAMDVAAKEYNRDHFNDFDHYLDYTNIGFKDAVKQVIKDHMILFASAGKDK